ncbi:trypsin-like peptidase domain-containing protein [Sorangium sp. So ce327]|uniref:trypsin-like peptidase domain-containing protein n=1 Tax=Sorangium sp. So ce327 TaxID=3133301 RepID=UPI003F606EFF
MPGPYLSDDDIEAIFHAAINSGIVADRQALFATLSPGYFLSIPTGGGPAAQLQIDLGRLNRDRLADGTIPFRKWLRNAYARTRDMIEGEVFKAKIEQLDRALAQPLGAAAVEVTAALLSWRESELKSAVERRLAAQATALGAATNDPLRVVSAAAQGNWLDPLLAALLAQRIDDAALVKLAEKRGLIARVQGAATRLERIVRERTPFVNVAVWRTQLARHESAIARVELEINGGWRPNGTGFLVGPDLLMTNHHVVQSLIGAPSVKGKLRFRFDYKRTTDGVSVLDGTLVDPADDWLVLSSPPSAVDEMANPGDQEPAEDELDFALIRLAAPVGRLSVGASEEALPGRPRGWFRAMKDDALALMVEEGSAFILQHPEGQELQLTFGNFLKIGPRRVRYDTNTLSGSSGSPCLDARLDLVALHQAGDPQHDAFKKPGYNQGIPMRLIVAMCEANGVVFEPPP